MYAPVVGNGEGAGGTPRPRPWRVVRIIARLNTGGPAHHVIILTRGLDARRFHSVLVAGAPGPGERELPGADAKLGRRLRRMPTLGPALNPGRDFKALIATIRFLRDERPDLLHTHTAKAGLIGRLAAKAVRPRPVIVHTFHGHVLEGYFGRTQATFYRVLERLLARGTDQLIGVSERTVDDLVRLGVAPRAQIRHIPLGLELDAMLAVGRDAGRPLRQELDVGPDEVLALFVGRLVPIKRVDVLLDAFAKAADRAPALRLVIAGDGEERDALERRAASLGIADRVAFLGFRHDLDVLNAAADIAVLSSDNEGTPVSLIEAVAAGRPVVATDAGGIREVVGEAAGELVPTGAVDAFADALVRVASSAELREAMGAAARARAGGFRAEVLVSNIDRLYEELLAARAR